MIIAQALLFSLFAPFVLWPIEVALPYPHILEELAKLLILLPLVDSKFGAKEKLFIGGLAGVAFALTESVFYLYNIFLVGSFMTYILRLALTIPFHSLTYLVILVPALFNKKLVVIGFLAAVVLHYFFNKSLGI